jgi:hypothetical protein
MDVTRMDALMAELGPAWPEVRAVVRATPLSWAVLMTERRSLGIVFEAAEDRVTVSATLDAPAEGNRPAVQEAMLAFNMVAPDHGGLRMGLDGDGDIEIEAALSAEGLTLDSLKRVMEHVAATGQAWKRFIADPGAPDAAPPGFAIRG